MEVTDVAIKLLEWGKAAYPKAILLITIFVALFFFYKVLTKILYKGLIRHAKTAKEKANTKVFLRLWRVFFIFILALSLIFIYTESLTALGVSAGFLGVILGWALQKPITGVAAWLMVITRKPFQVGDRIIIDGIKGDVVDITLTHIHLDEAGGTITGEEKSGRSVMIPCSTLFEKNVINFTLTDDFVLDEVITSITYESDIKKARKMCVEASKEILKKQRARLPKKPYTRVVFAPSSVDIKTRFYSLSGEREAISSDITQEIYDRIAKNKKIEIAYPHTEVIFRKKK